MKVIVGEARPVIFFQCSCGPLDPRAMVGDGYADGNFFPWFRTRLDDRICLATKKKSLYLTCLKRNLTHHLP